MLSKYGNSCSVRLEGTILDIDDHKGRLQCDNQLYGEIFIPAKADYRQRILTNFYKIGDKVSFFAIPANSPDKGCKFVAILMNKTDNDYRELLMENVKARVSYIAQSYGFVQLTNCSTKAFFRIDDAVQKTNDLTIDLPYKTLVVCDLQIQSPHRGCIYRARNVRRAPAQDVIDSSSSFGPVSSRFSSIDYQNVKELATATMPLSSFLKKVDGKSIEPKQQRNTDTFDFSCEDTISVNNGIAQPTIQINDNATRTIVSYCCDVGCQTDKMCELQAIDKILASENIFQVICTECPEVLKDILQSHIKF